MPFRSIIYYNEVNVIAVMPPQCQKSCTHVSTSGTFNKFRDPSLQFKSLGKRGDKFKDPWSILLFSKRKKEKKSAGETLVDTKSNR